MGPTLCLSGPGIDEVRRWRLPGFNPPHAAVHALEAAIAGAARAVVVIAAVVMRARYGEVLGIGPAAAGLAIDVVNLAFIGRNMAIGPRAHRIFRHRHLPLLPGGQPARVVQVHGTGDGVDEGDEAGIGKRALR